MPTETIGQDFIETEHAGVFELRTERSTKVVVWSQLHRCPVGVYDTLEGARWCLNLIRRGQALTKQASSYETLTQIVESAQDFSPSAWERVSDLDLPVSQKLLMAIQHACDNGEGEFLLEEIRLLADLAGEALKLENKP